MKRVSIFDSTLRDGAQAENITFTVKDKLNIVRSLDALGIDYIEAGNPGSNPKDLEFFAQVKELRLEHAKLVAFGSTRRRNIPVEEDKNVQALLTAQTGAVAIFGKSWDMHVTEIIKTTLEENLNMIKDTIRFLVSCGKEVFFDAEHFFDGCKENREYALSTLHAAEEAGACCLVLCDTNGGCFPDEIAAIVKDVVAQVGVPVGIHCHNDIGCAVANSIAAVKPERSRCRALILVMGNAAATQTSLPLYQVFSVNWVMPAFRNKTSRFLPKLPVMWRMFPT